MAKKRGLGLPVRSQPLGNTDTHAKGLLQGIGLHIPQERDLLQQSLQGFLHFFYFLSLSFFNLLFYIGL